MLSDTTRKALADRAELICRKYKLRRAYFAQVLGKRRHFLAGFGEADYSRPEQMVLGHNIALFWHGELNEEARQAVMDSLGKLARTAGAELLGK